jgi:uncharacterized membrane protein
MAFLNLKRRMESVNNSEGIITFLYCSLGLLFIGIGIPLALQRVAPNVWYGVRTARTLSDPKIWYTANRIAGIDLMITGCVLVVFATGIFLLRATVAPSIKLWLWCLVTFVAALLGAAVHSFWFVYRA